MAKPGRATQAKRGRELAKIDKRRDKEERRTIKKEQQTDRDPSELEAGVDPDLIGIIPGPQKPLYED